MTEKMLVLQNGKVFYGKGFGCDRTQISELSFNTSMVGYQEIISNPCYCGQMLVLSYPLIGNYGLTDEDFESKSINLAGLIVSEYNDKPSNFRYTRTLSDFMEDNSIVGISGIDTRELTQIIRKEGTLKAMITDATDNIDACIATLNQPSIDTNKIELVSSKKTWYARTRNPIYTVCAIDCGITLGMVKELNKYGCNVVVVPYNTAPKLIEKLNPDGLFISSGPSGSCPQVVELISHFKGKLPILGVGLGHQLIALSYGAKINKMKVGHHGTNYAVQNLMDNSIEITSQSHSYCIDKASLAHTQLKVTHMNLLDGEVEGMEDIQNNIVSMQYLPDSATSADGKNYLLDKFIGFLEQTIGGNNAQKNRY